MRGVIIIGSIALISLLGVVGGSMYLNSMNTDKMPDSKEKSAPAPSLIDRSTLTSLHQIASDRLDYSHLAPDVAPSTNKWFSGFALQADPKPGFNYPNSFKPSPTGFEISLPQVRTTSSGIYGPHRADVVVRLGGADNYKITRYDELTVDLTYYSQGSPLATVTLAEGVPYVFISAARELTLRANGFSKQAESFRKETSWYGMQTSGRWDTNRLHLKPKQSATFYSAPRERDLASLKRFAPNIVTSGKVRYAVEAKRVSTSFDFTTSNQRSTLFASLPHQQDGQHYTDVSYPSILGTLRTAAGNSFMYAVDSIPVVASLTVHSLSENDKAVLREQLRRDAAVSQQLKPDSYFGGKQLYRLAQLMDIAYQLEDTRAAQKLHDRLKQQLTAWLTKSKRSTQSFAYNKRAHGIVGNQASFGSDTEFNDHHFHYGYFIYASAVLARHDKTFLSSYKNMVNLLVADIANYKSGESLPLRRVFDPYAGHSWASGSVHYADGNNQESVAEAINAWTAVVLWGDVTKNMALETEGRWLLAHEATAAQTYWLKSNAAKDSYLDGYSSPLVSIVWGAKREYRTFFSDESNAKLAIELLPMNPTMQFLQADKQDPIFKRANIKRPYGDWILMAQKGASLEQARALPDAAIDDGSSRTYLYAWVLTH